MGALDQVSSVASAQIDLQIRAVSGTKQHVHVRAASAQQKTCRHTSLQENMRLSSHHGANAKHIGRRVPLDIRRHIVG